jgi:hypothetical protein
VRNETVLPVDLPDRRDLYNGFGETLSRAIEMVVTPAIFAALGYLLDGATGTRPLFTLVFFLVVFVYVAWRQWWLYDQRMRAMEEKMGINQPGSGPT